MDCVVNPPRPGDPSYELFSREREAVLSSLKERATLIADTFNAMEGFTCNQVQGAMYAFPQVSDDARRVVVWGLVVQKLHGFAAAICTRRLCVRLC